MNTNHGSGRRDADDAALPNEVSPTEHCACCVLALVGVGAIGFVVYPGLVALTRPLHVLSSTAIVCALVVGWLLLWLGMEYVWEWRAGRLPGLRN